MKIDRRKVGFGFQFFMTIWLLGLTSCGSSKGSFFYGALGLGDYKLIIASSNAGIYTISQYSIQGTFEKILYDYTQAALIPRGVTYFPPFDLLISLDGTDSITKLSLTEFTSRNFVSQAAFTGNIYQTVFDPADGISLTIESNTIEAFNVNGTRIGNAFINTTVGACVLNTSRGISIFPDGRIGVVGTGNDRILIYDKTNNVATCLTSNTALNGTDPFAIIGHSNGKIYIATQFNDSIYEFPSDASGSGTVIYNNTTYINNPTALLELPDGSILIASDTTNSIERINTNGTRIGSTPFIQDSQTGLVSQMTLVGGL